MGRRRSLCKNDRNSALWILQSVLSCRHVACTFEVAPSTISMLFSRFIAANSMCDSARSGCTRVTAQRQDNFIITLSLRNRTRNARTLTHLLRTTTGVSASNHTIRYRLGTRNLRPRRPAVRISLTRRHTILRLD